MPADPAIHPLILSGGSGTRLWPLSRGLFPKQLLALAGPATLLQDTARRVAGAPFAPPTVVCNADHRFEVGEQLREAGCHPAAVVLEPVGRDTAPAAAVAALLIAERDADGLMLVLPSDHAIADAAAFRAAVMAAAPAARAGALVTFGIRPTRPESGYGYIVPDGPIADGPVANASAARRIARFVEKPDRATAEALIAKDRALWNSGLFLFAARAFLAELGRLEPAILAACRQALSKARRDFDFLRLDEAAFKASPALSIDRAVMERTDQGAVVPAEMGWSDVGSFATLWEVAPKDAAGNAIAGDVVALDVRNSLIRSEGGPLVAALGLSDAVVIATADAVLVASRERAQDVRAIVEALKGAGRPEPMTHRRVHRPWGHYETLDRGERFQVKHILVKPGAKLSLQMHRHRAEHWVVVAGRGRVTRGEEVFELGPNQSTYIPAGTRHRLEALGTEPLKIIEVQSGGYLGEDDIVRFDDVYGRG